jgi:hypothetical protein
MRDTVVSFKIVNLLLYSMRDSTRIQNIMCMLNHRTSVEPEQPQMPLLGHLSIGYCDHRFCDHSSFPLCSPSYLCSQSSHRRCESCESNCDSPKVTSVLFFMRTCVPRIPNMINYIFSRYLQLSNGKRLSNDSQKRTHGVNDFSLGCCHHNSLMERDPYPCYFVDLNIYTKC